MLYRRKILMGHLSSIPSALENNIWVASVIDKLESEPRLPNVLCELDDSQEKGHMDGDK